jgi:gamma-glutamylputrescine oxidase
MFSYWEKNTWLSSIDFCIVGSGIVGLNTAISLKEKFPGKRVIVLERGILPSGASTKNAGFACIGSLSELAEDLSKHSKDEVLTLIERRWEGLLLLRKNLGDAEIDFQQHGGFELFTTEQSQLFERWLALKDDLNKDLKPIFKTTVYRQSDHQISQFGFKGVSHLIKNSVEGQLDTGMMMARLLQKTVSMGIQIITGVQVSNWEEETGGVSIWTDQFGMLSANKVIIATNGFARQLLPELNVNPGRAQVLITHPIEGLHIQGTFHYQAGYYYFRNIHNRLLFGGGRNLDFKGEETWSMETNLLIQNELERLLTEVILPDTSFEIDQRWAGTLGLGPVKKPIIEWVGNHTLCAVRLGGMGVVIGSLVGREAAEKVAERYTC